MSTRVQKGGTVFKPVAKPRPRMGSEARQSSHAPEPRASAPPNTGHSSTPAPVTFMPPPSTIPQKPPSSGPAAQVTTSRPTSVLAPPGTSPARNTSATSITPSRDTHRPPSLQTRSIQPSLPLDSAHSSQLAPTVISTPSRSSSRPPHIVQAEPVPFVPHHHPDPYAAAQTSFLALPDQDIPLAQRGPHDVNDAQIDPALLEAVVTALRHVDESQSAHVSDTLQGPQGPTLSSNLDVPPQRRRQSRNRGAADPSDGGSSGPSKPRGRRRRPSAAGDEDTSSADTRRRRSTRQPSETGDEESGDDSRPRRKRVRRARAPSVPPFDIDADPGEELDPTAVTMAELCDDLGRGKVSSKAAQIVTNHAAWRAANKEKRARLRAIAEAKKYGRNLEEEEEAADGAGAAGMAAEDEENPADAVAQQNMEVSSSQVTSEGASDQRGDDYDYTQNMSTSRFNVQVRIGPNGETIIDEGSLFVDRQEEDDTVEYTHIEESDATKFVNSMTYSKKLRGSRWSAQETELFYDALQQFGENYELISYILPGRDRKACKNKFKAEDKRNSNRINYCLKNRMPYDMQTLARMTGKDFSGPPPIIKAPTPPPVPDEQPADAGYADEDSTLVSELSRPPVGDDSEEIIGLVDE